MNKFLLEIGTEEIPALYIDSILANLKKNAIDILGKVRLGYGNLYTFGTPRRLVLFVEDIEEQQKDIVHKAKGPSVVIAFDKDGKFQKPALKFAQANQVKQEELIIENTNKGEYVFANKIVGGKKTEVLLPEFALNLITGLNLPKSMRWGTTSLRFIRPIRWLLALYNNKIIPLRLDTLNSNRITYGHRLLSQGSIKIDNVDEYFDQMEKNYVIIDPGVRKGMIKQQIVTAVKKAKGQECVEEPLLEEVKNLVELPKVLLGEFNKKYLDLPAEVLTAVMVKHQKYFPINDSNNSLKPFFLVVINGNEDKYAKSIVHGNERVLRARLEDAKFFYQEDQKSTESGLKPLDNNIEKLKNVVFYDNLGTIYDKVNRLKVLSQKLAEELHLDNNSIKILERAAQLCKSDLVTEMVKEFPELQGVMGKEYSLQQGENPEVATTIFEHYLPRFAGDIFPATITGNILSIADKLDNITSCFINNIIPDGSQDPYALRRQSLGIINIVINNKLNFSLDSIIDANINLVIENRHLELNNFLNGKVNKQIIKDFIFQRFRFLLLEREYRYDIVDAVLAKKPENIMDALFRIKSMQNKYSTDIFAQTVTAAIRAFNLSKSSCQVEINDTLFQEKEEYDLCQTYLKVKETVEKLSLKQKYDDVFANLETLNRPINIFFDKVLVMVEDEKIRNNRLALLKSIADLYFSIADLTKIALVKTNAS